MHIVMPTPMLLERAYCFVATVDIFSIYFNYMGEVSPLALTCSALFDILYQLQRCYSFKSLSIYAFPHLIAGAGN